MRFQMLGKEANMPGMLNNVCPIPFWDKLQKTRSKSKMRNGQKWRDFHLLASLVFLCLFILSSSNLKLPSNDGNHFLGPSSKLILIKVIKMHKKVWFLNTFTLNNKPTNTRNIWLLSVMWIGTIGIHSCSSWLCCSSWCLSAPARLIWMETQHQGGHAKFCPLSGTLITNDQVFSINSTVLRIMFHLTSRCTKRVTFTEVISS